MTIAEFFGTLQESITAEWRKHLQTDKYSKHMALDDFYKDMPEKVDALIEAYQADNEVVKDYKNILKDDLNALEYLQELKKITKEGRELLKSSELESLTDDILSLIDSTIYKLKHLKESMSLSDYLNESLGQNSLYASIVTEATVDWGPVVNAIQPVIDGVNSGAQKTRWGSELIGLPTPLDLAGLQKLIKKNKPTPIKKNDDDNHSAWVGFSARGKDIEEIMFGNGERSVKLHAGNAEAVTHGKGDFFGAGYCWANEPGTRNSAYECPAEVVQQIYDIVKSKY